MEALRVVVVALPARRPLVDGHNLVIVFFLFYGKVGKVRKSVGEKSGKKRFASVTLDFFRCVLSSHIFSLLCYLP